MRPTLPTSATGGNSRPTTRRACVPGRRWPGFREGHCRNGPQFRRRALEALKASVMAEISTTRQLSPLLPDAVVDLAAIAAALSRPGTNADDRSSSDPRRCRRVRCRPPLAQQRRVCVRRSRAHLPARHSDDRPARNRNRPFKVAWSPSTNRAVVIGNGLDDPGAGKAYELWRIDAAGPHAVRLLDKAGGGQVRRVIAVSGSPAKWAVTVEPAGGVDAPTGDVIFSASA